ncbi:unnamed protein product [Polarella glacialis]|uniref:Uncharacterized protein n=1 Tax=Polarella glacialis TaxID=89957 RepID=A0A813KNI5_POLGL|nr:unnamed protein product [Polarella glacialis]
MMNPELLKGMNTEVFGDGNPFGDPAWYQAFNSPYYNDTHKELRKMMRKYVEENIMENVHDWDEAGVIPKEVYLGAGKIGALALCIGRPWPDKYIGKCPWGYEPNYFHELVMYDELSRVGSGGFLWGVAGGTTIGLPPIYHHATEAVKDMVVGPCLRGEKVCCLCITEPTAGSDVANLKTSAKLEGDHYILNGEKKWITNGIFADYFTVACRTGPPGMKGISLLMVEKTMPGVTTRKMKCSGVWSSGTTYITFEDVKVPKGNLLGKENKGFQYIMSNFNHERWGICAMTNRFSRVCLEAGHHGPDGGRTRMAFVDAFYFEEARQTPINSIGCCEEQLVQQQVHKKINSSGCCEEEGQLQLQKPISSCEEQLVQEQERCDTSASFETLSCSAEHCWVDPWQVESPSRLSSTAWSSRRSHGKVNSSCSSIELGGVGFTKEPPACWDDNRYMSRRILRPARDAHHAQIELWHDYTLDMPVVVKRFSKRHHCFSQEEFQSQYPYDLEDPWQEFHVAQRLEQLEPQGMLLPSMCSLTMPIPETAPGLKEALPNATDWCAIGVRICQRRDSVCAELVWSGTEGVLVVREHLYELVNADHLLSQETAELQVTSVHMSMSISHVDRHGHDIKFPPLWAMLFCQDHDRGNGETICNVFLPSEPAFARIRMVFEQECLEFASGSNWYYRILPVGFCSAATMTFGNFQYLYMDLGFIQMLKAFTPVVVLISLAAFGLERPSMPVLGSVVLIALGTMVTAAAAPEWSIGLFFTFGAEVSEALRLTLTQLILSSRKFSVVEGQYILAPVVSACLLIGGSFTELAHAWESGALRAPLEYPLLFLWAAVLGIGVNYLSYLVIQTAGALTLKVLATLRNIGLIGYGIAVLGEQVSSEQAMGYSVALVGFVGYTYFTGTRGRLSSPTASTAPTQGVKIQ